MNRLLSIGGEQGRISLMAEEDQNNLPNPDQNPDQNPEPGSRFGTGPQREPRSYLAWVIAGVVIALIVIAVLLMGRGPAPPNPGGTALAPPAAYAKDLAITNLRMSQSSSVVGFTQTYIDGEITNHGTKTLTGITVQVVFRDFTGKVGQKNTMPMNLIRTRQPSVDVEPVSAAPIAPGETREFRLIFDHVTDSWNQQYPEIQVTAIESK